MTDETTKTTEKTEDKISDTTSKKTKGTGAGVQNGDGGTSGGTPTGGETTPNGSLLLENGDDVVADPIVNIGCKYPNGIRIQLECRKDLILKGYTKLNQSLWDKIAVDSRYANFIAEGTIFLSKNDS